MSDRTNTGSESASTLKKAESITLPVTEPIVVVELILGKSKLMHGTPCTTVYKDAHCNRTVAKSFAGAAAMFLVEMESVLRMQ